MRRALVILLLVGMAAYLVAFYATPLPGGVLRIELLVQLLLFPVKSLLGTWFGTPPQFSFADRLPVLLVATVILAFSAILGWLLLALCRVDRGLTRLENLVFSTAVGLNAVSTYVLLVGLLGGARNPWIFAAPAALTLVAAGRLGWRRTGTSSAGARKPTETPAASRGRKHHADPAGDSWLSVCWLWLAAAFVLMIVLKGMLPPVDFDVREYHLQVPKEFYQEGRIGFLPHNVYGNMALGAEMLSLLAMVIAGDWWLGALAGKTVIAAFAPLTALGLFAFGRRFFSPSAGVVAALLYISTPWIVDVSAHGLVDGVSACYLLLAVYAMLLWQAGKGQEQGLADRYAAGTDSPAGQADQSASSTGPYLLLAGYLTGGAISCKYPAVLFVAIPLTVWLVLGGRFAGFDPMGQSPAGSRPADRGNRGCWGWRSLGVFLLAAFVGCGLWFGKNWVLTGNPTYPLLYGVFDGKTWTAEKNRRWIEAHRCGDFSPAALVKDLGRVGLTSPWLNPLVVPLAVLAFLGQRRRRLSLWLLAYFGYVIAAWWLLTHRIDRFWIPVLPLLTMLAGAGACWSGKSWWRKLLIVLLLTGLLANFLVIGACQCTHLFFPLAQLRVDPERVVDPWHRYFNLHAKGGRVLMVGDAQMFDLEVPVLYNTAFDDCLFEKWVKGRTPEQIRATLAEHGVSHVYVQWGEIARYRSRGNYGFTDFVQPQVFEQLERDGVLERLPVLENSEGQDHPGRGYRISAK